METKQSIMDYIILFKPRIQSEESETSLESAKPLVGMNEIEFKSILRWEDDGGI